MSWSIEGNILLNRAKAKARTERLRWQGSKLVFVLIYSTHAKRLLFTLAWGGKSMFCKICISLGPYLSCHETTKSQLLFFFIFDIIGDKILHRKVGLLPYRRR
ncbi:hypothetical protein H105_07455 [Trichophyton soudanense CBS 452.61]|uniref:Uncharacterized protein n=1 Tax=Trichophyton soudanense CBS 452.61 TaxID=1215331 RepID=A0A022XHP2_TRISD|nr:hypothetical protein H105_07455 [Trichophyton soudanense CBS 452.61]